MRQKISFYGAAIDVNEIAMYKAYDSSSVRILFKSGVWVTIEKQKEEEQEEFDRDMEILGNVFEME